MRARASTSWWQPTLASRRRRAWRSYTRCYSTPATVSQVQAEAFSRNQVDGHIWLQSREAFSTVDIENAISKVKALGDSALNWRDIIRDYREGASVPEPSAADESPAGQPAGISAGEGFPGLMMV